MRKLTKLLTAALLLLTPVAAQAQLSDSARSELTYRNYLLNSAADHGKANWTNSGGTFAVDTSSQFQDTVKSFSFDPSATGQYVQQTVGAFVSLRGKTCLAQLDYLGFDSNVEFRVTDGTNDLASPVVLTATSGTPGHVKLVFPCKTTAGNMVWRVESLGNAAIGYFKGYLGENPATQVSQAQFVGTLTYAPAASCNWTNSSGTSFSNFGADTDCSTPTVTGSLSAPATKIPGFVVSNAAPGEYYVVASASANVTANAATYRLSDGTTSDGEQSIGSAAKPIVLVARIPLTTAQATWTVQVQCANSGASTCQLDSATTSGATNPLQFRVYRFPTMSETAVRPETITQNWSGYHDYTCSWGASGTTWTDYATGDATCVFGTRTSNNMTVTSTKDGSNNNLPGISFTPTRPSTYYVCASPKIDQSSDGSQVAVRMVDGAGTVIADVQKAGLGNNRITQAVCGLYTATSTSAVTLKLQQKNATGSTTIATNAPNASGTDSAIEWSVVNITQSLPMPILAGSVGTSSTGQERIERVAFGGASEPSACTASPCTMYRNTPGITGVVWNTTGNMTVSFAYGTFSAPPTCTFMGYGSVNTYAINTTSLSTTAWTIWTRDTSTQAGTNSGGHILCMGPK